MTDDERAIRALIDRWMEASRAGDTAIVLGLMTDDALFMVPGREPFGKEAFAVAAATMKDVRIEGTSEVLELEVLGDRAWMRNRIAISVTPPKGETVTRAGYALTILRKENGHWRLARDANLVM
jgi:uncharacterized protein (TIGR02246 family)